MWPRWCMGHAHMWLPFVWLLFVAAVTLFPFDFQVAPEGWAHVVEQTARSFRESLHVQWTAHRSNGLNVLLFVPLGAWLRHRWQRRFPGLMLVAIAAGVGLLCSLTIECVQGLLPSRRSSLVDILTNTAGTLLGALAHWAGAARGEAAVARLRAGSLATLAGLLAGFTVLALLGSGALQLRTRLATWSVDYPLLIGNERTGTRPWRGRVVALEVTDATTPSALVHRFSAGELLDLPGRRVAAFDFSSSPPYGDAAGNVPDRRWTPYDFDATGTRLPGRPWLQSDGPASAIAQRLRDSNAFTLRVLCATDDVNQEGPARIVSNSLDTSLRNFTLGQRGRDLAFRLRTAHTGLNGFRPEILVPGVFDDHQLRDILVTYDGATLLLAVAGTGEVHRRELSPGSSLAFITLADQWRERLTPAFRIDELKVWKMSYVAALFVLPGVLIGLVQQPGHRRMAFGLGWVLTFAVLLESTLVLASGQAYGWGSVGVTVLVGAVVVAAVASLIARPTHKTGLTRP